MYFVIEDHDTLFIISEVVHACGILVLGFSFVTLLIFALDVDIKSILHFLKDVFSFK